jgi:hypothetical protein
MALTARTIQPHGRGIIVVLDVNRAMLLAVFLPRRWNRLGHSRLAMHPPENREPRLSIRGQQNCVPGIIDNPAEFRRNFAQDTHHLLQFDQHTAGLAIGFHDTFGVLIGGYRDRVEFPSARY